uniref:uncharacterized protein LOC122605310 isoform X2 n=1 Tax=Erigeron canadensis TaxID=72917 RepID=UPI001CB88B79|nr:uncharacterized protein LOC122605310 isoform X2 [Erigeron canadensis]
MKKHSNNRLYQTQRILMKNLQISMLQNQETQSLRNNPYVCFEYQNDFNKPQKQDNLASNNNEYHIDGIGSTEIENECDIELTLGPTSSYTRRKNKSALTRHLNLDSMPSFSTSSTGLSHKTRENFDRSLNQPHWLRRVLI